MPNIRNRQILEAQLLIADPFFDLEAVKGMPSSYVQALYAEEISTNYQLKIMLDTYRSAIKSVLTAESFEEKRVRKAQLNYSFKIGKVATIIQEEKENSVTDASVKEACNSLTRIMDVFDELLSANLWEMGDFPATNSTLLATGSLYRDAKPGDGFTERESELLSEYFHRLTLAIQVSHMLTDSIYPDRIRMKDWFFVTRNFRNLRLNR